MSARGDLLLYGDTEQSAALRHEVPAEVRAATCPGISGRELHAISCVIFEMAGYRTQRTGPGDEPEAGA